MKYIYFFLFATFILILSQCSEQYRPVDYYPVDIDNTWLYTGILSKVQVTEKEKKKNQTEFIMVYFDSTGIPIWKEKHILRNNKLLWTTFSPQTPYIPEIRFDPPIPTAPFSDKLGDKKRIESTEVRLDSSITTVRVFVDYEVESIENVELPTGFFPECVKMKMTISYPDPVTEPYMAGTSYFWFARGVGPISFIMPSGQGSLISAKVGNKKVPQ